MWQYEYMDNICPLQNNKKRYVQTLTDTLKILTKKRLQTFLLHLMIIKRKYAWTPINT